MNSSVWPVRASNWAVILAGGDGMRLRELSYSVSGDARPKQFCSFFGGKSLLEHTRERVLPLFHNENMLFALNRAHEAHYRRQLADVPASRMLVQPSNRGTAAAIALAALEILQRDIDATIAFFPSDHHYLKPSVFQATVGHGLRLAKDYPDRILIVGAPAHCPEVEYGWIQPGRAVAGSLHHVAAFREKPSLAQARAWQQTGWLWNAFVTIGSADAFVQLFAATAPRLLHALGDPFSAGLDRVYDEIGSIDFSRDILSAVPHRLLVLRDGPSGWTDFGSPQRAMDVLHALAS